MGRLRRRGRRSCGAQWSSRPTWSTPEQPGPRPDAEGRGGGGGGHAARARGRASRARRGAPQPGQRAHAEGRPRRRDRRLPRAARACPSDRRRPSTTWAWRSKQKDEFAEAESELRKAIALDPSLPEPHFTLGVVLWQTGRAEEALKSFDDAIAQKADYAEAHYMRAPSSSSRAGWTRPSPASARRSAASPRRRRPT